MNHPLLAKRLSAINESATIQMAKTTRALIAKGEPIINLTLGEPDFDTPDDIKQAGINAIIEGYTKYTPVSGFLELREAIQEKFQKDNHLNYEPSQIVVSCGAKHSIMNVIMSLVNPGDEIIIPTPYWVSYSEMVKLAGGIPIFVETSVENDYKLNEEQMRKHCSSKSRLFIFSSPCNPSGSVYTKDELEALANVAKDFPNLFFISDEIYEYINYQENHISLASIEGMYDKTITINGVSKGYSMTGWRIGYLGAPEWIANACEKLQGQFTSGASSISQMAALYAIKNGRNSAVEMKNAFKERRSILYNGLREIDGVQCNLPQGAFYVFPDFSEWINRFGADKNIKNSQDLCLYLLTEAKVATVAGSAFGKEGCIRISYAASDNELKKATAQIQEALTS